MTDRTIPAGLTREEAQAVLEWAERARVAEVQDETVAHAARVLLAVLPKRPTLADMAPEERAKCQWMQAGVENEVNRAVIVNPFCEDGTARVLWPGGFIDLVDWERVTPRPDLPRLEWPGGQKPAPSLPDGWRLADHEVYGRVVVTSPTPSRDGRVYFVLHDVDDDMGYDWDSCPADELTYIDTDQ